MPYRHPTSPASWPDSPQSFNGPPFGGETFQVGMLLGEIRTEGLRQTEIMLAMLRETREMPDRIAQRLPQPAPPPPAAAPSQATSDRVTKWLQLLIELARAATPIALIAAVALGKISVPEAAPLIRSALGLGMTP